MKEIEKEIKDYLDNFFTPNELIELSTNINPQKHDFDDTTPNDPQYINACKLLFDKLKNSALLDKYRIEVGPNCTYLIEQLFKTYVDKDTFLVISSHEHNATTKQITTPENKKYMIYVQKRSELLKNKESIIKDILTKFKESGCKKIFCIMVGTTPHTTITVDQEFFIALKNGFVAADVPHIMVLDDCQGLYMIERNYDIFDAFLGTTHVLYPLLDPMGIIFTKLPKKIGFIQRKSLLDLNDKLNILLKSKEKAIQFNSLLSKYFESILQDTGFEKYENEAPHQFGIHLDKTKTDMRWDKELITYGIKFNPVESFDNFVRMRYQEIIVQSSDAFIEGLNKLSKVLYKLKHYKQFGLDVNYSNTHRFEDGLIAFDSIRLNPVLENSLDAAAKQTLYNRLVIDFKEKAR